MLEEARGVEYAERLARRARGHFTAETLLDAATCGGHTSLGWPDAGEIAPGAWADLVTVSLDSVRTAGAASDLALEAAIFGACAADVRTVVIGGRDVVRDGVHLLVPDVPGELSRAIRAVLQLSDTIAQPSTETARFPWWTWAAASRYRWSGSAPGSCRARSPTRPSGTPWQVGYRHIDTATMYRNEDQVGRAIADSGLDRSEVFLTTKLPPGNAGRVRATIDDSLKALRTDHVDLWLVHWPPRSRNLVPLWRDFLAVRDEGLTRAVGVSNYSVGQIDDLIEATGEGPAVNQIPWSPSRYDEALLAAHAKRGVAVEGYSPLKGTRLRDRTLVEIAASYGVTPAQVVLRWHLEIGVIVIPKSSHPERIEQNLDLFSFSLTPEEVARISRL